MAVLRGMVRDKTTKAPLPWVLVMLDGYSTTTDRAGLYSIEVPTGTYTLKVRAMRYRPYTVTIDLPEERTYTRDIELELAAL